MTNGTTDRCRVCDEPLAPGAPFCPRCGTRVEDAAAAGDDAAMTGLIVDDPTTAAPGAYDATQVVPGGGEPTGLPVAGAPVDAGEPAGAAGPTPEEEEKARRMRLLVAGIVAVIVIALVVLVALAFTSGGGGGNPPSTSVVPSTAVTTPATLPSPTLAPTNPPTNPPTSGPPPTTSGPPPTTSAPTSSPPSST